MARLVPAMHVLLAAVTATKAWIPVTRLQKAGHDDSEAS